MPDITVTPKYVNAPNPNGSGKYGSIVLADKSKYFVPADKLSLFAPNVPTAINFGVQKWGENMVNVVTDVAIQANVAPPPPAAPVTQADRSDKEGAAMFVRGVLSNVFHGTGTLPDRNTLTRMVADLRWAWHQNPNGEINMSEPQTQTGSADSEGLPF